MRLSGRRQSAITPETRNESPTVSASASERGLVVETVAREDERGAHGAEPQQYQRNEPIGRHITYCY